MGGRAQRLPPRCIADNDDGGLCFERLVVVVVGHSGLEFVDGTGAGGVGALLFIVVLDFVVVLVLVVLVPCEEATLKK